MTEEGIKGIESGLSIEQQERMDKFVELSNMMSYVYESLKENKDSKAVEYAMQQLGDLTKELKGSNLDMRDFLAGKILLNFKDLTFDLYSAFDTENHEIEKTIDNIFNERTAFGGSSMRKQPK